MISVLHNLELKLGNDPSEREILLVPGEVFYCHSVALPSGISESEIEQFVELSLEGLSPFPLEQLSWGYLHDEKSPTILIYAAYRQRLENLKIEELERYYHVLPGFISACDKSYADPTITFLSHENSLSALVFNPQSTLPVRITTLQLPENNISEDALFETRQMLISSLGDLNYHIESFINVVTGTFVDSDNEVQFEHRILPQKENAELGDNATTPYTVSENRLWEADIREIPFKQKERKKRSFSRRVWHSTLAVGIAAALFLLLQILFITANLWINFRENAIEERDGSVAIIEQKNNLLLRIEQIAQNELKPFEMLAALNLKRPKSIYFTQAVADGYNKIHVDGEASNVEIVNRYIEQLRTLPHISDAKIEKIVSRSGKAPFSLIVTFNTSPFNSDKIVADAQLIP